MLTAALPRSKALLPKTLLLGASVLALSAAWHGGARADTTITGNSGPVRITSGGLVNKGTLSGGTFAAAVNASGSLTAIINSGTIAPPTGSYYYYNAIVTIGPSSIYGAQGYTYQASSIGTILNAASGTIINSGWGGALSATGASIGTFSNAGIINGGVNLGNASIYSSSSSGTTYSYGYQELQSTIGQLTNAAGATIQAGTLGGRTALSAVGASIGTLINAGIISGGVDLSSAAAFTYSSSGTSSSFSYQVAQSTIGQLINGTGATIGTVGGGTGLSAVGASIGTLTNAGVINGDLNLGALRRYPYSSDGTTYSFGSQVVQSTIGQLTNAANAAITGNIFLGTSAQTIENAGKIGGSISAPQATIAGISNDAGATLGGISVTGGTIGSLINSGIIAPTTSGYYYGAAVDVGVSSIYGTQGYTFQASSIGTILNAASGTIINSGWGGALSATGASIGTFTNAGLINGGVNLDNASIYSSSSSGTTYSSGYQELQSTIGQLTNAAGATIQAGTISGRTALSAVGASIGTLTNAGIISGGVNLSSATASTYSSSGTTYSYGYQVVQSTIGQLINGPGATIGTLGGGSGLSAAGASIGTLSNAGVINGNLNLGALSLYTYSSSGTTYSSGYQVVQSTIGQLTNAANATITGNIFLGTSAQTIENAGKIGGSISAPQATIAGISNDAGATLGGISVTGGTIGSLINSGIIAPTTSGYYYGAAVDVGVSSIYGTQGYTFQASSIGTILNAASGTIGNGGWGGALSATGASIGTFTNAGLINGGVTLSSAAATTYTFNGTSSSSTYQVVQSTIGQLTNTAGATIGLGANNGYYGTRALSAEGASIGTLTNAGVINGWVDLNSVTLSTYASSGTVSSYGYMMVQTTIGQLINAAGGTIGSAAGYGLSATGASIGTVTNNGVIRGVLELGYFNLSGSTVTGTTYSYNNQLLQSTIGQLTNTAGGTIGGILLGGFAQTISNAGLIDSYFTGFSAATGTISTFTNAATGTITGGFYGVSITNAYIGTLANNGLISDTGASNGAGVVVGLSSYLSIVGPHGIGTLVNASGATISGLGQGIHVDGDTIGTLINNGVIVSDYTWGQNNHGGIGLEVDADLGNSALEYGSVGTLANAAGATISGGSVGMAVGGGTIGILSNNGVISGGKTGLAMNGTGYTGCFNSACSVTVLAAPGSIGVLDNAAGASIVGGTVGLSLMNGTINTLMNAGLIAGTAGTGIFLGQSYYYTQSVMSVDTLVNTSTGTITGGSIGINVAQSNIGTLLNQGLIIGTLTAIASSGSNTFLGVSTSIGVLVNTGTLLATGSGTLGTTAAVALNSTNLGTLVNNGQIIDTGTTGAGIRINAGTLGTLLNLADGTIAGGAVGVLNTGTLGALENVGVQKGSVAAIRVTASSSTFLTYLFGNAPYSASTYPQTGSIGTLSNSGTLTGGMDGLESAGLINTLTNNGTITGGTGAGIANVGAFTSQTVLTGYVPIGHYYFWTNDTSTTLSNAGGNLSTLNNSGLITGGQSGIVNGLSSSIATVISSSNYGETITTVVGTTGPLGGTIGTLVNAGTILGVAGAGIDNGAVNATIGAITNSGLIQGGQTGIINAGTIGTLTNSGTITGAVAALRNTDSGTLGPIVNTGVIAGDILSSGGQALSITGGAGTVFGTLTGAGGTPGTLASTNSNITLAGNLVLNDMVSIAGHTLVADGGSLVLAAPTTITGNYSQSSGTLAVLATGTTINNLTVSGTASISGATVVLTSQYAYGLTSGASYTIVTAGDATSSYSGVTALAPGYTTTTVTTTLAGGLTDLIVSVGNSQLTAGSTATIAGGNGTLDQMTGGTLAITGGTPTVGSISGGAASLTGGSANIGTISGGTVSLTGGSATLGTVSGGAVSLAGGTASLTTVNSGSVSVSGGNGSLGMISGGTVSLTGGSATLGTITGGTLAQTAGAIITGTTAVQVMGGSLNLGGTVTAPLAVNGGLVAVNGQASGTVTVGSGGTLRGSGVVTGSASVSGILAPGNSPGTLTFTNGLTQGAKSVLSIDIDGTGTGSGAGNYSRVLVTGGSYVIGSGAVLTPKLRGITGNASNTYTPSLGTDFTVVQAAGGVSGTFTSVVQPASGLATGTQFTALYATNAVDLFVTPTYGSLASLGASANQQALGRVVAGLNAPAGSDLATVLKALYSLPSTAASLDALAQMGGSTHANIAAYSLTRGLAATQVLGQRLAAVRDGVSGGMQGTMQAQLVGRTLYTSMASGSEAAPADERGMAAGSAAEDGWHFWAQGLGAFSRVDSDGNAQGGHSNTGGGLFGGDRTVAPGVTLGLAGTLLQSTSGGSNETSSYGLSAYGNADLGDGLFVAGNAGYTYDRYDTARTMGFGGLSRTAFGHTTGDELGAGVTAGYRMRVSNLTLEPQAGIQWLRVGRDGFTETGAGALNLVLQDLDATALQSSVGARASGSWKTDGGTVITPTVRASWLHDFRDRALTSQAAFAGTTFAVTGPDTGANALGIGGGLTLQQSDNLNLYANYDGTLRRHETDHVFTAGLRLSW
ncbi:autotransporter outer membrane beta-barrel domain-containing protein [Nitrospirillum iridis]|uniref:Uncharacterized protein with beta-barrel porin domain n=1 Tax=Nitrospirillum iridis TaxID=765888 RepID=A0A7X0AV65_9PROT|nr:autotransporter outer membrane beta-barrel domain-containing protein [Nitrospirillum iridis]MBB6249715.1 uncharacterized protein with beta-barrel porin domain [Nitrospirillum iridis]